MSPTFSSSGTSSAKPSRMVNTLRGIALGQINVLIGHAKLAGFGIGILKTHKNIKEYSSFNRYALRFS